MQSVRDRLVLAVPVMLVGAFLAGCGSDTPPPSAGSTVVGDVSHDGELCPDRLPQATSDDYGFGTSDPAEKAPSLPAPERAWVCEYGSDASGARWDWRLSGGIRAVPQERLRALRKGLDELEPGHRDQICTADLGPRLMLVYTHGSDHIGVVVDAFGCSDVRLTDDPLRTIPGEGAGGGTVPGVLADPGGLRALISSLTIASPGMLVLGPIGVGPLAIGMSADQVKTSGAATTVLGSAEEGWRKGCRMVQYAPDVLGHVPDDTLNGTLSTKHGLEQLYATDRMMTPEGIHLGSSIADLAAAYDRPHLSPGDEIVVRASAMTVYRILVEQTVTSMVLEVRKPSCEI